MTSPQFSLINNNLLNFYYKRTPLLPDKEWIEELIIIEGNDPASRLKLHHLYTAIKDIAERIEDWSDFEIWDPWMIEHDWDLMDIILNRNNLFRNLEDTFHEIPKKGRRFTIENYLETYVSIPVIEESDAANWDRLTNQFNDMPIQEVVEFFKVLKEKKAHKDELWLTEEGFNDFIKKSFCGFHNLPKPSLAKGSKYAIVTLFYRFYEKCHRENITKNNRKEPYIELLKNAFETDIFKDVDKNFKGKRSKYDWGID